MRRRWLTLLLVATGGAVSPGAAQAPTGPLEFFGLRPGMSGTEATRVLAEREATLRCHSTAEARIQSCSAQLLDPDAGWLAVTLSLVDGDLAIGLVAATLTPVQTARWYEWLTSRYGTTEVYRRPGLESFQWIRAGQMLRLTVRRESGGLMASVSLVDGALLDGLPPP